MVSDPVNLVQFPPGQNLGFVIMEPMCVVADLLWRMRACVLIHVHMCVCMCVRACVCVFMHVRVRECVRARMYVHARVCACCMFACAVIMP